MTKPCKNCGHKKGSHIYFPQYHPGGEFIPDVIFYPCQEKDCTCFDYRGACAIE